MAFPTNFTPDAARALGGPDWLAARRVAAVEQLDGVTWPTATEEIWRYSRIGELDLDRYRPFGPDELGAPGVEPAPGGGPFAAEAGERSGLSSCATDGSCTTSSTPRSRPRA